MVRTRGTVATSRGRRNEYRISTLTPLLTAAGELLDFASAATEPLPGLGFGRTWGGAGGKARQGQRDPEAGRAGPQEVEAATVGLHQGAGQGEADAVPALARHPAFEQPRAGLGGDARPLVLDRQMAVVAGRLHHHPDRAPAVAEGVVEEDVERLPHRPGGGPDRDGTGGDQVGRPPLG